jgi:hypothetical protein
MPEDSRFAEDPSSWDEAFAKLPLVDAPVDGWGRVTRRLQARRRQRMPAWLAIAAALVLAITVPWKLQHDSAPVARPSDAATTARDGTLESLYAQSAQLEALLRYARDDRVSSGSAVAISARLDQQLASIDAALAQPGLSRTEQHALWRRRIDTLRTLASFESNRRLLSARGERYDGVLVRVD